MAFIKIIKDCDWNNKCSDEERINAYKAPNNPIIKICNTIALSFNGKILLKNGNNYMPINLPANNYWTDIAYGNGIYIAISSDNEWNKPRAITSKDGDSWTLLKMYFNYGWKSIRYYHKLNIFIAIDSQENIIWIDAKTLKSKLFKYKSQCLIASEINKKSKKSKKHYIIEENIIYWSMGTCDTNTTNCCCTTF